MFTSEIIFLFIICWGAAYVIWKLQDRNIELEQKLRETGNLDGEDEIDEEK